MIRPLHPLVLASLLASLPLMSQQAVSGNLALKSAPETSATTTTATNPIEPLKPFSRLSIGGGIGINGINLQAGTNVNPYLNLRAVGDIFSYTVNNITTNDFDASGKLD